MTNKTNAAAEYFTYTVSSGFRTRTAFAETRKAKHTAIKFQREQIRMACAALRALRVAA